MWFEYICFKIKLIIYSPGDEKSTGERILVCGACNLPAFSCFFVNAPFCYRAF